MADRLAHEIGNAMVPLSTHQQLLADKYKDPEFRASLDAPWPTASSAYPADQPDAVSGPRRDVSQEAFPLATADRGSLSGSPQTSARQIRPIEYEDGGKPIFVTGDRAALKHALTEVMLNALQANPTDAKNRRSLPAESDGNGMRRLQIEVQDNGAGFTPEAAQRRRLRRSSRPAT